MTDADGYEEPILTRREALKGGSAAAVAAGAALYSDWLVGAAQAQLSDGDARIVMGDQGDSPAQDGEMTHNAGDVEVHSGGAVRNLTSPTFDSVDTNETNVTNETLVIVELTTDQSFSSGSFQTVEFDSVVVDERGEWDPTNHQFSPDKEGHYHIAYGVFFGSGSDGDDRRSRFTEINGDALVRADSRNSAVFDTVNNGKIADLNSSEDYEVEGVNFDSSDVFVGAPEGTFLTIRSAFRHP